MGYPGNHRGPFLQKDFLTSTSHPSASEVSKGSGVEDGEVNIERFGPTCPAEKNRKKLARSSLEVAFRKSASKPLCEFCMILLIHFAVFAFELGDTDIVRE